MKIQKISHVPFNLLLTSVFLIHKFTAEKLIRLLCNQNFEGFKVITWQSRTHADTHKCQVRMCDGHLTYAERTTWIQAEVFGGGVIWMWRHFKYILFFRIDWNDRILCYDFDCAIEDWNFQYVLLSTKRKQLTNTHLFHCRSSNTDYRTNKWAAQ